LVGAQGEEVAADAELDGVAEGRTPQDFDLDALAKAHLEEAAAYRAPARDTRDAGARSDLEPIEQRGGVSAEKGRARSARYHDDGESMKTIFRVNGLARKRNRASRAD